MVRQEAVWTEQQARARHQCLAVVVSCRWRERAGQQAEAEAEAARAVVALRVKRVARAGAKLALREAAGHSSGPHPIGSTRAAEVEVAGV